MHDVLILSLESTEECKIIIFIKSYRLLVRPLDEWSDFTFLKVDYIEYYHSKQASTQMNCINRKINIEI